MATFGGKQQCGQGSCGMSRGRATRRCTGVVFVSVREMHGSTLLAGQVGGTQTYTFGDVPVFTKRKIERPIHHVWKTPTP